jgi:hypothetical protein
VRRGVSSRGRSHEILRGTVRQCLCSKEPDGNNQTQARRKERIDDGKPVLAACFALLCPLLMVVNSHGSPRRAWLVHRVCPRQRARYRVRFPSLLGINSATKDHLDALPGIGKTYAQRVIDGRSHQAKNRPLQKNDHSTSNVRQDFETDHRKTAAEVRRQVWTGPRFRRLIGPARGEPSRVRKVASDRPEMS